jgi:fused signal recognition particle receptor
MGFFEKLKAGLSKTKSAVMGKIAGVLKSFVRVDEDLLDELEEILYCSDMGAETTEKVIDSLRERIKDGRLKEPSEVKGALKEILRSMVGDPEELDLSTAPSVILVIGVNGVGKTTTIGKISAKLKADGKSVVVAAADTFRAAAIDQLEVWTNRAGVELIRQNEGSDPAAVVFDACAAARKRGADVLIVDTAGRLHNKKNLMDELAKIDRVLGRELPGCSRETLLVLDSTTGQNAVIQAAEFKKAAEITGIILTKLDGTAKGGAVFAIKDTVDIPVKFIGVGEAIDDMEPFDADQFVRALLDAD